ncbi:hypothetical protein FVEG_00172 [Fusarium verticillioides 7600]|uniref:Uncharacterized protein n=1 Tax=Gibberella moniliformis (strain M3125 / FGSC 7600) TaxID=334819 RepID=W7L8V1_GIBM7|nr:hypothetical protein FVEG_00172 [Fusarium verticillioides 7600]EWG35998.1 hypothetical protein FVEG_00172 [Fusarium verticillioides 7600]
MFQPIPPADIPPISPKASRITPDFSATDPESSSPPSETLDSAPGSSGSSDAVGNRETGGGSEVSHSERGFENGQSPDWDDDDLEEPEEKPKAEDSEGSD